MKKIAKVGILVVSCVLLYVPCIGAADVYCPPLGVRLSSYTGTEFIVCKVVNYKSGRSPEVVTITVFDDSGNSINTADVSLDAFQFGAVEIPLQEGISNEAGCTVKGGGADLRVTLELIDNYFGYPSVTLRQIPCPPSQQ